MPKLRAGVVAPARSIDPMRVLIIGGTEFIGRRIVEELAARGDELLLVHRGVTEPADLVPCRHLHVDRRDFGSVRGEVDEFAADAVVDTRALTAADVDAVLGHLGDVPIVVLSSMDVYRAYECFNDGREGEPVPFDETAPVRERRHPYRGAGLGLDDYEKLEVEAPYLERGATVLRLGMVYGEHDPQRREEPVLRRLRGGRSRIPVGNGDWLWTRCYVGDAAAAVLAALDHADARGEIFNIGDRVSLSIGGWMRQIVAASGHDAELVTVPDDAVPDDLALSRSQPQHMLADTRKATEVLGWQPADAAASIERSVRWHRRHPPPDPSPDFAADDRALAR